MNASETKPMTLASWAKRGGMRQYSQKTEALAMLRRLLTEKPSNYTKVPMMGHTHLYFCSPSYGHADYNKICTCDIEGNEEFVKKSSISQKDSWQSAIFRGR